MPTSQEVNEGQYLENKDFSGNLLGGFVKPSGQAIRKKIVNGQLQIEYDPEAQTPASSKQNNLRKITSKNNSSLQYPSQSISFNDNRLHSEQPRFNSSINHVQEIRDKLYLKRNKPGHMLAQNRGSGRNDYFQRKWQQQTMPSNRGTHDNSFAQNQDYGQHFYGENDPVSNLILKPSMNNRSHLDSNHTLRSPFPMLKISRPTSVRSMRSRTADTLNRRFLHHNQRPIHIYRRFHPSLSKYEHDLIRSQQSRGNSLDKNYIQANGGAMAYPLSKFNTEQMNPRSLSNYHDSQAHRLQANFTKNEGGQRVYQNIPGLNNNQSFGNLRPGNPDNARGPPGGKYYTVNMDSRQGLINARNTGMHQNFSPAPKMGKRSPRQVGYGHQNYLYANKRPSITRSHYNISPGSRAPRMFHSRTMEMASGQSSGRSNILAMFFRKILVFNSKLEGLKQKLFAPNSGFDCQKLFRDFAQENPEHLSMEELMSLFQSLDFNYSPQIVYKILLYLIRKESTRSPFREAPASKKFQLTPSGRLMEVLGTRLQSMSHAKSSPPGKPSNSDHLDYSKFESFFCPIKETATVLSDETLERSLHGARAHENFLNKEAIFHLVRQIVILSLRKLEDLGWVIRSLRLFPPEHLFQILGPQQVSGKDGQVPMENPTAKKSNRVTSISKEDSQKPFFGNKQMRNSLTFQNIPNDNASSKDTQPRSKLLNQFLAPSRAQSMGEVRELPLQRFLKANGVDFLSGDLIYIFKELGSHPDKLGFDQFSSYVTADLWSL